MDKDIKDEIIIQFSLGMACGTFLAATIIAINNGLTWVSYASPALSMFALIVAIIRARGFMKWYSKAKT